MNKSPLSTPGGQRGNFNRGRQRGYGYNRMRNNSDNFQRFPTPYNRSNHQFDEEMIPLETSSPVFYSNPNNRGNRQQPKDRRNQRFSMTGVSGSYNNYRSNFQSGPQNSYSPNNFHKNQYQQQNQFRPKHGSDYNRRLPISEFINLKNIFENPWAELESRIARKSPQKNKITTNDSSIEIIYDKNSPGESLLDSSLDGATINISSSCEYREKTSNNSTLEDMSTSYECQENDSINTTSEDVSASYECQEGSSIDLAIEGINVNHRDSQESIVLNDSTVSQDEKSQYESTSNCQSDSVEILYVR